jgi:tetratricopeptide (TPR) repeat protein
MDTDPRFLRELTLIRRAIWLFVICFSIASIGAAVAISYAAISTTTLAQDIAVMPEAVIGPCKGDSFYREADALYQKGSYRETLALAESRLEKCPSDGFAWWWKAKSLALLAEPAKALSALDRAELIRPDWRNMYVEPLRKSLLNQQAATK